jgi:peptidoglycan hydrolase-like protein with peptidoglycan-binding domain
MIFSAKNLVCGTLALLLLASLSSAEDGAQKSRTAKPASKSTKVHKSSKKKHMRRVRGQKAIDGDRVREIQEALARERYLKSTPSGKWDSPTQEALRRYQSDHGWQSKTVPDSRALISLGLGPDQEHLLNPESAMTSRPVSGHEGQASGVAASAMHSPLPSSAPAASLPSVDPQR